MQRLATVLLALLAALALAGAAGTFQAVDSPELSGDRTLTDKANGAPANGSAGGGGNGTESAPTPTAPPTDDTPTPAASGDGGISPLFVAVFVGGLLAAAAIAILLTGDDDRAQPPPADPPGDDGPPTPTVRPEYDTPDDNAVVRAWRRLADDLGADESAAPAEVADDAIGRGFPADAVSEVTAAFRAVRYGAERPDGERARRATDAARRFGDSEKPADSADGPEGES